MVLNPYLLVDCALARAPAVDFFNLNRDKCIKASKKPGFLYFPESGNLIWYPAQKRAEVSYKLKRYIRFLSQVNGAEFTVKKFEFEFRTLNARDWGFDYAYMDFGASKNMRKKVIAQEVLKIDDFIHCGSSCGQEGGCNNHSPYQSALDGYSVKKLPALARFKLWRNAPANPSSPPDFTFDIKFL